MKREKRPFYTLKALIRLKYGRRNFNTGCKLVARWIIFETKLPFKEALIGILCETTVPLSENAMNEKIANALVKLFGLPSPVKLYTTFRTINTSHS